MRSLPRPGGRLPLLVTAAFAVGALTAVAFAAGAPTQAAAAAAQGSDEAVSPAFQSLSACAQESGQLLALFLLDESGSLQRTDPEAARVTAAGAALRNLAPLADRGVDVEVALTGFATDFQRHGDWSPLDADGVPELQRAAGEFADRDSGLDTDFFAALDGAWAELARRSADVRAEGEPTPCKLLLLFTDGDYDVEERDSAAQREHGLEKYYAPDLPLDVPGNAAEVESLGRELLCGSGGVVDEMRDAGVVTTTVALETEISPEDRDFLRAVSAAPSNGARCGADADPALGAYVPASDLSQLLLGFDRVSAEIRGGALAAPEEPLVVCGADPCPQGRYTFELDESLAEFHLLLHTGAEGVEARMRAPDGTETTVGPGTDALDALAGVEMTPGTLSPLDVVVDGRLPGGGDDWVGTWSVTFVDPSGANAGAPASARLYLFGALRPRLVDTPTFRRGEQAQFAFHVTDGAGSPAGARVRERTEVGAAVTDPVTGRTQELDVGGPDDAGRYVGTYAVPSELSASAVNLTLTVNATSPSGLALQPSIDTTPVPVAPPVSYPRVTPPVLNLTSLTDGRPATGTVTVTGGESSGGCVWFPGVETTAMPRLADGLAASFGNGATSQADCVRVEAGQRESVTVEIDVGETASGQVRGTLQTRLASDADPTVLEAAVPFAFDMFRPVNQLARMGLFLGILVPGLLLPFLVLWALNWLGARFEPPGVLRHAGVPVRLRGDGAVQRLDGDPGGQLRLRAEDFRNLAAPLRRQRRFAAAGLTFRPRVPWWPFKAPYGTVTAPGSRTATALGAHAGGSGGVARVRRGTVAKVPFSLARQWVFVLDGWSEGDHDDPDVTGRLHVFVPEGTFGAQATALEDGINRTLPGVATALARRAEALQPRPATPGEGDLPSPPVDSGPEIWIPPAGASPRPWADDGDRATAQSQPWPTPPETAAQEPESTSDSTSDSDLWRPPPRR